jgi:hypothetical protein
MTYLEGTSQSGGWQAGGVVLVRTATMPTSVLTGLRFGRTLERADRIRRTQQELARRGEELADRLHPVIGSDAAAPVRPALIGLRRALHRAVLPAATEWGPVTAPHLPSGLGPEIGHWVEQMHALRAERAALPECLAEETTGKLRQLRAAAGDGMFRHALLHAGPTLLRELEKWDVRPEAAPKTQKVLRLARFVARAAAKTSPFSSFMLTSVAHWGAQTRGGRPARPVGVIDLDGGFLADLRAAVARHPALSAHRPIRVNPSWVDTGLHGYLLAPVPGEPVNRIAISSAVRECVRRVRPAQPIAREELLAQLMAATGQPEPVVGRFLARLLVAGVLLTGLPVDELAADQPGRLADWASAVAGDGLTDLTGLLRELQDRLDRPVDAAEVDQERLHLAALTRTAQQLSDTLAGTESVVGAGHETVVVLDEALPLDPARWLPVLADLDVVRRFLVLFESRLPVRLAAGAFFAERFGATASVPFVIFHHAVQEALAGGPGPAAEDLRHLLIAAPAGWSADLASARLPAVRELAELREKARAFALQPVDDDGVVRVGPADLAALVATWPEWARTGTSTACYLMPNADGAVLNVMHGGRGRGRGRLEQAFRRVGGPVLHPDAPPEDPEGPLVAELSGLHGSTLNLRDPWAPAVIDYPGPDGLPNAGGGRIVLPLADLQVRSDARTGLVTLHSDMHRRPVTVVHLGMASDLTLPPAARSLERLFGDSYLVHPSAPALSAVPSGWEGAQATHHPRVCVGRVTVQRARWFMSAREVPVPSGARPDADHLLRLLDWLDRTGIPRRSFVRAWSADRAGRQAKERKPVYFDAENWFLVADLHKLLSGADFVMFDEALPDPGRPCDDPGARVREYVIELTGRADD